MHLQTYLPSVLEGQSTEVLLLLCLPPPQLLLQDDHELQPRQIQPKSTEPPKIPEHFVTNIKATTKLIRNIPPFIFVHNQDRSATK